MSDFFTILNDGLAEINETPIVLGDFATTRGVQNSAKKFLNKAYFDIVGQSDEWPWLKDSAVSRVEGTTVQTTTAGVQWYAMAELEVDWHTFYLTDKDPETPSTAQPDVSELLEYMTYEQWFREFAAVDNQRTVAVRDVPKRVIRHPDGKFGLSPVPDDAYYVEFHTWETGVRFSAATDIVPFQEQFEGVLIAKYMYYLWKFRDNLEMATLSLAEYKEGIKFMKRTLLSNKNERMRAV